jgi:hypothetical protein
LLSTASIKTAFNHEKKVEAPGWITAYAPNLQVPIFHPLVKEIFERLYFCTYKFIIGSAATYFLHACFELPRPVPALDDIDIVVVCEPQLLLAHGFSPCPHNPKLFQLIINNIKIDAYVVSIEELHHDYKYRDTTIGCVYFTEKGLFLDPSHYGIQDYIGNGAQAFLRSPPKITNNTISMPDKLTCRIIAIRRIRHMIKKQYLLFNPNELREFDPIIALENENPKVLGQLHAITRSLLFSPYANELAGVLKKHALFNKLYGIHAREKAPEILCNELKIKIGYLSQEEWLKDLYVYLSEVQFQYKMHNIHALAKLSEPGKCFLVMDNAPTSDTVLKQVGVIFCAILQMYLQPSLESNPYSIYKKFTAFVANIVVIKKYIDDNYFKQPNKNIGHAHADTCEELSLLEHMQTIEKPLAVPTPITPVRSAWHNANGLPRNAALVLFSKSYSLADIQQYATYVLSLYKIEQLPLAAEQKELLLKAAEDLNTRVSNIEKDKMTPALHTLINELTLATIPLKKLHAWNAKPAHHSYALADEKMLTFLEITHDLIQELAKMSKPLIRAVK